MHLPDAFLDTKTVVVSAGAAAAGVAYAVRRVQAAIQPRQVPMLGLAGAFIFAAQMLNFPVPGGTSGHLVGGVLAAVLLGPSAAVLVLTCVLIVQCLMFADGGLLALGANVFNMGIVAVCGGHLAFQATRRLFRMEEVRGTVFAAAFAGWFGTVLASITCAGQLALSGTAPWGVTLPAMAGVHMVIGIGEGAATGLVTLAVLRSCTRLPNLTRAPEGMLVPGLVVSLGLVLFVAPFACPWPDGLERVAETLGFASKTSAPVLPVPFTDYSWSLGGSATLGTALAGLLGTVAAFGGSYLLARLLVPVLSPAAKDEPSRT